MWLIRHIKKYKQNKRFGSELSIPKPEQWNSWSTEIDLWEVMIPL